MLQVNYNLTVCPSVCPYVCLSVVCLSVENKIQEDNVGNKMLQVNHNLTACPSVNLSVYLEKPRIRRIMSAIRCYRYFKTWAGNSNPPKFWTRKPNPQFKMIFGFLIFMTFVALQNYFKCGRLEPKSISLFSLLQVKWGVESNLLNFIFTVAIHDFFMAL